MSSVRFLRFLALGTVLAGFFIQCGYAAITTSWWRFEIDDDPSATGFSTPNEVVAEPAIISSNARIGGQVPDLFDTFLPGTDIPNTGSALAVNTGGANAGIFGVAQYSPTLDLESFTVEFWVRTTESTAGFVARTTVFENAAESATPTNGFSIVDPNNVQVRFVTSDASGSNINLTNLTSGISINDGDWHYIAFRYDEETRSAVLTVDSQSVSTLASGTGIRPMWWGGQGASPQVVVGYQMDGNQNNNTGTFDELRITDQALDDSELLIPEPGTAALIGSMGILLVTAILRRTRRSR